MEISAKTVMELRHRSGSGIMDCKKALQEAEGDQEKAYELLRKRGAALAEKRAGKETSEGRIGSYIHAGARIGVLVEVNCETDFVANTDDYKALVKDLAMQVAATSPSWVRPEDVPEEVIKKEREILAAHPDLEGKPDAIKDKIIDGRLKKFYGQCCLLEQEFVKEPGKQVKERIQDAIGKLGENITVRRFSRFEVGA